MRRLAIPSSKRHVERKKAIRDLQRLHAKVADRRRDQAFKTAYRLFLDIHRDVNAAINILKRSGLDGAIGDSLAVAG